MPEQPRPDPVEQAVSAYLQRRTTGQAEPIEDFLTTTGFAREVVDRLMQELDVGSATGSVPASFGRYHVVRELGRGGMGSVHLAVDTRLEREVALKCIRPELLLSAEARRRFENETKVASRLDHPNLCKVFDAGEHDGRPYLVMQYVRGETLAARIAAMRGPEPGEAMRLPTAAERLLWIEKVAGGLHHAHAHGLIHRDVKPSNVLVDEDGEPRLLDFGLARQLDGGESLTATGTAPGTYRYMSPEQLRGAGALDGRTDVFSLAVVASELLLLRHPFAADTDVEVVQQIRAAEPCLTGVDGKRLGADVQAVLCRALAKDRDARYATAAEFAEDLGRVRRHEPPLGAIRPGGAVRRWWHRHRFVARGAAAALGAVAVAGLVWHLVAVHSTVAALQRALAPPVDPMAALERTLAAAADSPDAGLDTAVWRDLARAGWVGRWSRALADGLAAANPKQVPDDGWVAMVADPAGRFVARISAHGWLHVVDATGETTLASRALASPSFNDLGGLVAALAPAGDALFVGGLDGVIQTFATDDWSERATVRVGTDDPLVPVCLTAIALDANGRTLAAGSKSGRLLLRDLGAGRDRTVDIEGSPELAAFAFDPTGAKVLIGGRPAGRAHRAYDALYLVDAGTGAQRKLADFSRAAAQSFCWHPRGRWVAVGTAAGELQVIDTAADCAATVVARSDRAEKPPFVRWCAFAPSGEQLLAGMAPGIAVFDWHDGTAGPRRQIAHPHGRSAAAGAFAADGGTLAVLFPDSSLGLVSTADWRLRHLVDAQGLATLRYSVQWAGPRLLAESNASLACWQPPPGNSIAQAFAHTAAVNSVDVAVDGRLAIAVGADGRATATDPVTGVCRTLVTGGEPLLLCRFAPDGKRYFVLGEQVLRLFARTGDEPVATLPATMAAFCGDRLVFARGDEAWVLDAQQGEPRLLCRLAGTVSCAAADEDLGALLIAGADHDVHVVWSDPSRPGRTLDTAAGNQMGPGSLFGWATALARVPGSHLALVSCINAHLGLLHADATGAVAPSVLQLDRFGGMLATDPRGRWIAASDYSFGRLTWLDPAGLRDGRIDNGDFAFAEGHDERITAIRASRSGNLCLTASLDGTVRIWEPVLRRLRATMRLEHTMVLDACFTPDELWFVTGDGDGRVLVWPVDPVPVARDHVRSFARRSG